MKRIPLGNLPMGILPKMTLILVLFFTLLLVLLSGRAYSKTRSSLVTAIVIEDSPSPTRNRKPLMIG